jgi:N12 class adenine-specific DNA methylase
MPDKKYYVYVPGTTEPTVLSQGDYDAKKDKLFSKFADANVVEMQGYDRNEEIGDSDFFINIPGSTQPTQISAADFAAKKDKIYQAYPGVEVSRIRPVDYWGDRLKENYDRKNQLEEELKGIPETEIVPADPRVIQGGSPLGGETIMREKRESPERLRRSQIQRELDELGRERENNPVYQKYRQQQISELDGDLARVDEMKGEAKQRVKSGDDFSLMDEEVLNVAKNFYEDAKKIAAAPSKYGEDSGLANYWKGVRDNAWDAISFVSLAKALGTIPLLEAVKQIQRNEGDDANILDLVNNHPEQLTYLSDPQKEMMRAFVKKAEVEASRDELSQGYKAGQSSIQSVGFMADFLLTGGLGEAAANKVAGKLVQNTAKGTLGRLGAETLHGLVKASVMSPLMPSTYSNILNNMAQLTDEGGVDTSGRAVLNAVGDAFIENVSETIGAKPLELLGWGAGKALPSDWLTKTKFGSWGKALRHSPWFNAMKNAGWNGFVEEMFEEVSGNALRAWTGIDKDALRDFMKSENILTTAAAFAPMTFVSGGISTAQYISASKKMREAGAELEKILASSVGEDNIKSFLSSVQDIETPEELGKSLGTLYKSAVENGEDGAVAMKVLQDYASAASTYKFLEGIYEEQKDIDRAQRALELETKFGDNWSHEKDGERLVRTITGPNGETYYVKSEDEQGFSVIGDNGLSFIDKSQIESGEYIDSGETPYNEFLDESVKQQKSDIESTRIDQERQDAYNELLQMAQPGTEVNLGTIENPVTGVIQGMQAGRYIVASESGVNDYSKEEMANILGVSLTPKTDDQIQEEEVKKLEDTEKAVRAINTSSINLVGNQIGLPEDATIQRLIKMDDGSLRLYYTANGESMFKDITDADLAELEGRVQESAPETETQIVDDGTPRDFRGNPLPMRTNKQTGQQVVDGNALWNKDPEAWAKWNDTNPNQKVGSKERLEYTITELDKEIEKDSKAIQKAALKGIEEDEMDKMDSALQQKLNRRNTLISVLNDYNLPVSAGTTAAGEQRKAKAERVKAEQKAGFPGIQQKWEESPKIVGAADEIRLPNGEIVTGNYVLTESDAPTASHNPSEGFKRTEGFPVDENGKTVNDRDYEHDKAAQKSVIDKAGNYDQRALQTPVIVSADGVVLSGNDRTMASQLAASNNTDKAYTDYLGKYSSKYGFSKEQVGQFEHPRVVFVPDTEMAYNAANFAKFNAEEKKSQSKTEKAVKAGKTLTPQTLGQLATLVDRFDDINALYNDANGVDELLNILLVGEVITQEQLASLKDGNTLSGTGMDLLESTLIGAALDEEAVRIAMQDKSIRKSVVSAISQIITGNTLEGYTLRTELSDAINLVSNGKKEGLIKTGDSVQGYIRQGNLFGGDVVAEATVQMLADAINSRKTSFLKNVLSLYNRDAVEAANGQMSILTNDVPTRDLILREILSYLGYDTAIIFQPAAEAAESAGETETGEAGPVVQSDAESQVTTDRDQVAAILEETGESLLAEYITDEEAAEFMRLYNEFQPANDALGQAYTDLKDELESKDKETKQAAQDKIKELEAAQVTAFQPVQDYAQSLMEQYGLNEENPEDEIEEEFEEFEDFEEEEKPKKKSKKAKKSKEAKEPELPKLTDFGGADVKTINKTRYSEKEMDEFVWGSTFGTTFYNEELKILLYLYGNGKHFGGNEPVSTFRVERDGKYVGQYSERNAFWVKYIKANKFVKDEESAAKKNKYGFWEKPDGIILNRIEIRVPSVKKGHVSGAKIELGRHRNGKWEVSGWASYSIGGSSLNHGLFDKKSDAIRSGIESLTAFHEEYQEDHWTSKDVENLIRTLKTKTLPQALLEEGAVDSYPRTEITAAELDNGVQGLLFGEEEPAGTIVEEKPKRKTATKKAKKETNEDTSAPIQGEYFAAKEQITDEEGTPGNYNWTSERVCTNPTVIVTPSTRKVKDYRTGEVNKIALAERDGKWYWSFCVVPDGDNKGTWGESTPYFHDKRGEDSREAAIETALSKIRFALETETSHNNFGRTFNETKELIDYIVTKELPKKVGETGETSEDALGYIKKALDNFASNGNYARVVRTLEAYQDFFGDEVAEEIDTILSDLRKNGISKESKDEMIRRTANLYNRLIGNEEAVERPVEKPVEKPAEKPVYGANNKIITTDKYEELKARMQEKLGRLNAGFDPEVFFIGAQMAAYHVEAGARKFIDFSKRMINDLGDAIRPYLKAIYNGARDLPGMEEFKKEMTPAAEVENIDVDSIQIEAPVEEAAADTDEATEEAVKTTPAGFKVGDEFDYTLPATGSGEVFHVKITEIKDGIVKYHLSISNEDPTVVYAPNVQLERDDFKSIEDFDSDYLDVKIPEYEKQVQFLKEQEANQGEVEAAEPVVKQVDVNALFGAVNDLARGKREEVKVSDFAEPIQEQTEEEENTKEGARNRAIKKFESAKTSDEMQTAIEEYKALGEDVPKDWYYRRDFTMAVETAKREGWGTHVLNGQISYQKNRLAEEMAKKVRSDENKKLKEAAILSTQAWIDGYESLLKEKESPAETKEAPAETTEEEANTLGEIGKYTHTKTGKEMTIVRLTGERVSADEFKQLKARAKKFGGYYSSYGSSKGFLFDNEEDAIKFNTIEQNERTDKQTAADTAAIVSEAASVAIEAESLAEAESADEGKAAEVITRIDEALDAIDDQLALLGYYEADESEPFHESYGYMKSAEKKAVKDADKLAKRLAKDLGIEVGRKQLAKANIAPAGGEVYFRLPLNEGRELYVNISLYPDRNLEYGQNEDSLVNRGIVRGLDIMYRVENPNESGQMRYETANSFAPYNVSYLDLLKRIRYVAKDFLNEQSDILQVVKEQAEKSRKSDKKSVSSQKNGDELLGGLFDDLSTEEKPTEETPVRRVAPTEVNGYKKGDKVLYIRDGKAVEATIYDFEYDGRPVLDAGLAPVLYEVTDWENIKPLENGLQRVDESSAEGTPSDNSGQQSGLPENEESAGQEAGQEGERADRSGDAGSDGDLQGSKRSNRPRYDDSVKRNTHNNRISKGEVVYPKTTAARFKANVAAIRVLKELQDSGKQASKEQMSVLRQFTGWGGMGGYFNNEYSAENRELRSLLTDDEMQAAALSINTAYYTPVEVIDSMWEVAKRLGFEGGNVLEGSAGIGNILASMPKAISEHSQITAVELDGITGGILELLYPDADVMIKGFQDADIPNGSVDLAITNVPFGNIQVYDSKEKDITRKFGGKIHDFCIAKNVRKLSEGGLGIFISTRGTLDNSSKALRQWIVNEGGCDVIGAFRLNNETFEGTGATSDIIVVRKRVNGQPSPNAINVSDTEITRREEYELDEREWNPKTRAYEFVKGNAAMEINRYFVEHPENMGGVMGFGFEHNDSYRPGSSALWKTEKIDQTKRLEKWAKHFTAEEKAAVKEETAEVEESNATKEGQLVTNSKGEICISRQGKAVPLGVNSQKVKGYSKAQCLKDYDALKAAINETLDYQLTNESDEGLKPLLAKLNRAYDNFKTRYDRLNKNTAISFLRNDVDFPAIAAVEDYKETKSIDGKVKISVKKTSIFEGRVLGAKRVPTPKDAKDGVIVSINQFGRIDIPFIAEALKKDEEEVKQEIINTGLGFENPQTGEVEVEYEYLSGNVREKLEYAKEHNSDGKYDKNIKALEKAVPADIPAHLIEFSLGSDWLPVELYKQFAIDRFGLEDSFRLINLGGVWSCSDREWEYGGNNEKNRSAGVHSEKLRMDVKGHELMVSAMNNKPVVFSKTYKDSVTGESVTERDPEATNVATAKMAEMRDDFKEWARAKMLAEPELSERITKTYNDTFNAIVPKEIKETFIPEHFEGMATKLNNGKPLHLRVHQAKAVIRATTEPLMMAHEVGSGKTFTLITTAMEMRRLGTAKKPMIVVQNATLGQFVSSAKELYPNAKVLTISESDRTADGRSAFYAKIKYNDWDIIIVPQSVFEMMPDSEERQRAFVQERIDEKKQIIQQAKDAGDNNAVRNLEKELKDLEYEYEFGEKPKKKKKDAKNEAAALESASAKAKKQLDRRTDDVSDFDDMGIDALLVDEAHSYKHLGFSTSMQRGVKGVDPSGSKKSAGVYLKTRAVFDKVGWKNVVFATGTPISNTAAEIWTFMKYLMPADVMRQNHIYYFDDFVRNFGNISQSLEFKTNGEFKDVTRFASYSNLPELIRIWSSVCDTVLTKDAIAEGEKLEDKQPKQEDWKDDKGTEHKNQERDIYLPQSPALVDIMTAIRKRLAWFENLTGKEKKENSYIPLTMFGLAKMAAIDPRLVDKDAPDVPESKTNRAVAETLQALKDSEKYKGTCALFCDNFRRWDRNENGKRVEGFNIFDEIKRKLVAAGVPEDQIVIMKSGMSTAVKEKTFARVNSGEVRVIMGSTGTLGTGVNIQERLFFAAHLDAPDRPMDYTQRNGRILRQGNLHREWNIPVRVVRFGVEDSLDVTAYQRLSIKAKFIKSVMDGKPLIENGMDNRVLEEEEEGEFDNPVAVLSGSEYAMLKSAAERELRKLRNKKEQHRQDQIYIERTLKENANRIAWDKNLIEKAKKNLEKAHSSFPEGKPKEILIEGHKYSPEYLKDRILTPLRDKIERKRNDYGFTSEDYHYTLTFDGIPVDVKVTATRSQDWDTPTGKYKTTMRTLLHYSCPTFGVEDRYIQGGYAAIKDIIPDFSDRIASGREFEDSIKRLESTISRLESDNELMLQRRGKPFADEDKLKKQEEIVKDYTEKMKAEMAAKEAKYAEMVKNAKTNFNLEGVEVEDEEDEEHESIVTDEASKLDVSDPLVLAEAVAAVNRLAKKLNLKVKFDDTLEAKGAYSGKNGIRINLSNCDSVDDAVETLLHEGVAHFGLRQLLGNEGMEEFISDLLKNATNNIKARIEEISQEQGKSMEYAAEEYVAELAEKTDYTRSERSLWRKIVEFIRNVFDTITGRQNRISDDTIRELLIASYENLEELESEAEYDDEIEHYRLRTKPAPEKTIRVFKLMRMNKETRKPRPLYIDTNSGDLDWENWYDADSPDMSFLKKMPSGIFLVDAENGTYTSLEDYQKERKAKPVKLPTVNDVNYASENGLRWVKITDTENKQARYEGENRKYENIGINGSGAVSTFAMRPGYHAGSLPTMRQIGSGPNKDIRDDDFVWVEGEISADVDYNAEAQKNPGKDIPTHIPTDGYYMKATNANAVKSQADRVGWYIAGSFKPNRFIGDTEARSIIDDWNKKHPDAKVEYDYNRAGGREFNAETFEYDEPQTREGGKDARRSIWERYENQDGEKWPWMYESDVIEAIEREVPYGVDTEHLFILVDKYKRLKEEDFDEGKRDFSGGEAEDVFEEILDELQSEARNRPAFHGSGASFESFDISHLGEGEGAQAHGWGHYVALTEKTAMGYAERLANSNDIGKINELFEKLNELSAEQDRMIEEYKEKNNLYEKANAAEHEMNVLLGKVMDAHDEYHDLIDPIDRRRMSGEITQEEFNKLHDKALESAKHYNKLDELNKAYEEANHKYVRELSKANEKLLVEVKRSPEYQRLDEEQEKIRALIDIYQSPSRPKNIDENADIDELNAIGSAAFLLRSTRGFRSADEWRKLPAYEYANPQMKAGVEYIEKTSPEDWQFARNLYSVEIPDDNGSNYIDEDNFVTGHQAEIIAKAIREIPEGKWRAEKLFNEPSVERVAKETESGELLGEDVYHYLSHGLGGAKRASKFLSDLGFVGIKYVGGEDGPCAVIFKDEDVKIVEHQRFRYAVTQKMDEEYLKAVEEGDMEKAQRMVNEAAALAMPNTKVVDENGKPLIVYHGSSSTFNVFEETNGEEADLGQGIYFTDKEEVADTYTKPNGDNQWQIDSFIDDNPFLVALSQTQLGQREAEQIAAKEVFKNAKVYKAFLNIENPYIVSKDDFDNEGNFVKRPMMEGYDGIIDKTATDRFSEFMKGGYQIVAYRSSQIKSAEPVTYDDNGKVIPLSKRFDFNSSDIRLREGYLTDALRAGYEQSMANMREKVTETAEKVGVEIKFRPSKEMMYDGKPLAGRWINGKMYICLEHCRDNDDAIRTVLHEGVGHNGLRKLVGDENMDSFCIQVFNRLPKEVREQIAGEAISKYNLNIAEAVEEYLAEQAEVIEYKRTLWDIVRDALRGLLEKLGIIVTLNDNDVRWILWQSYNANKQGDLLNEAKRQVMAKRFGFTLRQQAEKGRAVEIARNREAGNSLSAARIYNKDVMNWMSRLHETWVDKDDSVNRLVNAIEKSSGKKAKAFEDIRLSLNQQSSKGLAAIEQFEREHYDKMTAEVKSIMDKTGKSLKEVERYVMIKHALERNEVFAKRDALNYYRDEHDTNVSIIKNSDKIDDLTKEQLIAKEDAKFEKHKRAIEAGTDIKYRENRNQDYGGLTAMFSEYDPIEPFIQGVESNEEYQARVLQARHPKYTYIDADGVEKVDMQATEKAAEDEVKELESLVDVTNLWKEINGATKFTLKHQYDANMLSREQYSRVKDMFKYYVPLRGFAENTAEDMYDYYNSDQRKDFTPPLLIAKGRKSEAESPFGYIGSMASSAIAADMKNETKLALYYFVSNRADNDLVGISEVWFKNTGIDEETGKRIFTPVYPPFKDDLSKEEAKKAYEEWEKNMEEEAKAGFAFKGRKKLNLHNSVIHIDDSQQTSHVIKFKVGGREMMMYINGNPRAAQAINNELNVEMSTDYQKVFGKVLRWFSGINTSYNPEFWLSNAQRDALFALMSVDAKENPEYAKSFRKTFGKILKNTITPGAKNGAYSLKKRLDSGNLGEGLDELYKEFVENGGVTGYTTLKNNEEWELEIRNHTGKDRVMLGAVKSLFEKIQGFGEAIEQMTRFAAYVTSRQSGKDIKDSVNDAKELTVNFNRKGSGKAITFKEAERLRTSEGKPLTLAQKAFVVGASWLPVYGRRFIIFFNASVQGLNALYKLFKKNPSRMGTWVAGYVMLGVMNAVLHSLMDDDDDYLDIPDYERRNNLLVGGDGVYFKWALPQEARVFYAMGDMAVNHILGREPHKGMFGEVFSAVSDIAPLNPSGGVSALAPSALSPVVEVVLNRDYKGSKIYNDLKYLSDEERKRTPAYKQAYQGTGKLYTIASEGLNWLTGGDYADAGWININPAVVEHLLQGATGGAGTTIGKMYRGTIGQIFGEDFAVRNTPFLSRLLTITDDRYRNAHTTELFDYYKAEAEHTKKLVRQYSKNGDEKKLDKILNSEDYEIMLIYESYRGMMNYYNEELKVTEDKKERKELMREQDSLRKEMINEISELK